MPKEYLEMGALFIVVMALIKLIEFLINKYTVKTPFNGTSKAILQELQTQNQNHLHSISVQIDNMCKSITTNNVDLMESIHRDNVQIIQLLGEIKGVLSSRR